MEEDFPRGGSEKKEKSSKSHKSLEQREEEDLFNDHDPTLQKENKKSRKEKKKELAASKLKQKSKDDSVPVTIMASLKPEPLRQKHLYTGMTVLGYVSSVQNYSVQIALPNGLKGKVPITNISRAYTQKLETLAEAQDNHEEEEDSEGVASLSQLFKVGMMVPCKVMGKSEGKAGKKEKINLSVAPHDVNSEVSSRGLQNNMVLYGSISSCEDHGYTLDLGVPGVHAFLPSKQAENFIQTINKGSPLMVGQLCRCKMEIKGGGGGEDEEEEEKTVRAVSVTIDPSQLNKPQITNKTKNFPFNSVIAGMKVKAFVDQVVQTGLQLRFGGLRAVIHTSALPSSPKQYSQGDVVTGCVLSVHPLTKAISLTLQPHVVRYAGVPEEMFAALCYGDLIEEAVVTRFNSEEGVFFKLPQDMTAFAGVSQLESVKNFTKDFKKGSKHRCRVVGYGQMEGYVVVSLKKEILDRKYMRPSDINPGDIIKVKILEFLEKGVTALISKGITGFIPKQHMSDITLQHPEKKFEAGQMIKCRVMHRNKKGSILLTHKKSLVSSRFPVPTNYESLERGMDLQGYITGICSFGVFVSFFNHVQGLVPRSELSVEAIDVMEKVFYLGQVVQCRVLSVNPAEKKLKLTCKLEGKPSFGKKMVDAPEDFEIGKIIGCKVLQKTDLGLDVLLTESAKKAYLPRMHLSDSIEICNALWELYQPDDVIDEVMYYSKKNVVLVTRKESLLDASRETEMVKDFDELEPGNLVLGWVQNTVPYGVFVELPGQLVGLVPKQYVCDRKLKNITGLYTVGQSVCAKVVEVHKEKRRYLGSLRTVDCYHGNTQVGLDLLRKYLTERNLCMKLLAERGDRKLSTMKVGGLYSGVVKLKHDAGIVLELDSGLKAVAPFHQCEGLEVNLGQKFQCAVLYVDLIQQCVEVSLDPKLLRQLQTRHSKGISANKVEVDQHVKSMVRLVKQDFVLVSLKGQCTGQLAYLPGKKHLSDILECNEYGIGQENKVVIKSVEDDVIMASLEIHEMKEQMMNAEEREDTESHVPLHDLNLGDICTATVRKVWLNQMQIKVANTIGRVHQTDIVDSIVNGNNPLRAFNKDMEIKVRVIGFRRTPTGPVKTLRNLRKGMPECSIKPSVLALKNFPDNPDIYFNTFIVGDMAVGFAMKYSSNCWWFQLNRKTEGRLFVLNMSENIQDLQKPETFFQLNKGYNVRIIQKVNDHLYEVSFCDKKCELKKNSTCLGIVKSVEADRGLSLLLEDGYRGSIDLTDMADKFEPGLTSQYTHDQVIQCYVLDVDTDKKQATLSLRPSRIDKKTQASSITDPEVVSHSQVKAGQVLKGFVSRVTALGVSVRLGRELVGLVASDQITDSEKPLGKAFPAGSVVTVKVLLVDKETKLVSLSILEEETNMASPTRKRKVSECKDTDTKKQRQDEKQTTDQPERKRKISESKSDNKMKSIVEKKEKKRKTSESHSDSEPVIEKKKTDKKVDKKSKEKKKSGMTVVHKDSMSDSDSGVEVARVTKEADEAPRKPVLEVEGGFSWDTNFSIPGTKDETSSDESEDEQDQKTVKKSKEEIRQQKRDEERKLFEYERQTLEGERLPETADDFDRLVLQSPNSSLVWLRYMAFHLETSEIDRARAVAERALKTISFVEEQEKLNVWVAYLNLENMYGTNDTLNKVLTRALQQNDQIAIYTQMIDIYVKSNKTEEAEHLFNILVKKHSSNKDIWVKFGQFYFQQQRLESARKLLQRCLKSLNDKHHVETIAKFAQMEFKFGEPERGKTMYDNILSSYPGRTDMWSVYLDMVTKLGDHTCTRNLYNKVVNLKLGAKKMKFFYKKFLQFEEKYGSKSDIADVKKKALEYVESQGYVDE